MASKLIGRESEGNLNGERSGEQSSPLRGCRQSNRDSWLYGTVHPLHMDFSYNEAITYNDVSCSDIFSFRIPNRIVGVNDTWQIRMDSYDHVGEHFLSLSLFGPTAPYVSVKS